MKWLAVAVAACSAPAVVKPPTPPMPTGPELVVTAPGVTAFAIDRDAVFWLAPGGVWRAELPAGANAVELAPASAIASGLAIGRFVYWNDGTLQRTPKSGGTIEQVTGPLDGADGFALSGPYVDLLIEGQLQRWNSHGERESAMRLDGDAPVIAEGSLVVVGTTKALYQLAVGSHQAPPIVTPIDGGVRALAVDGEDVFFGNTTMFEKLGASPVVKLGPAGGPVTAIAADVKYVYWATDAGDRDPAIYRAARAKPERELVTKIGAASALVVAGDYLYWVDHGEGAIHRIRR